jgi:hypothetical protein
VEVAYYDTFQPAEYGYSGCWSVYPYFPSGRIIASDMQTGLYVFQMADSDSDGIFNVNDNCVDTPNADQADSDGDGVGDVCEPCQCLHQGDFDDDGFLTPLDLGMLIDVLFAGQSDTQDPLCPSTRSDFDCDGFATPLDLGVMIDYLFAGGPALCDPCAP